jgi:hypothetical protein
MIHTLSEERATIDYQLSRSISNERERGIKPDWDWIRKARLAKRIKGIQISKLNDKIRAMKSPDEDPQEILPSDAFMMVAVKMLPEETKDEIWSAVFVNWPHLKGKIVPV